MRRCIVWMAVAVLSAPFPALAQSWQAGVGLQGGFTYFQMAGGGSKAFFTELTVPSVSFAGIEPNPAALYFIVPVHGRFALEPSFAAGVESGQTVATVTYQAGLRGDYLLAGGFYVAGGLAAGRMAGDGRAPGFTVGAQAAAGYRFPLMQALEGRVEAVAQFWTGKQGALPALDTYSLMFGVTAPFAAPRVRRAPAAPAAAPWRLALGTAAGFTLFHIPGIADYATFAVPSWGGTDFPYSIPSLYLTVPVGGRVALEPGLSVVRFHEEGYTAFDGTLSLHVNYAFRGGWYAGIGGHADVTTFTSRKLGALTGVGVQGGYRFRVAGPWDARIEVGHEIEARHRVLQELPFTATSVSVGVGVALR